MPRHPFLIIQLLINLIFILMRISSCTDELNNVFATHKVGWPAEGGYEIK